MKKIYISLLAVTAALVACNKQGVTERPAVDVPGGQIVLDVSEGFRMEVETKQSATPVTSMPHSLYWGATTGAGSYESLKWAPATATVDVSNGKISTGKYQTSTPTAYNYYAANYNFNIPGSGHVLMTVPDNTYDIIAGKTSSSTSSTTPSVTLGHIFARTGSLTLTAQNGYSISGTPTWKIVGKSDINGTAGEYDMSEGQWTSASTKLSTAMTFTSKPATGTTSTSDIFLIPGTYTVSVTYTLTKGASGEFSKTYTKSSDITLQAGKIHNINGVTTPDDAQDITLSVTLQNWQEVVNDLEF